MNKKKILIISPHFPPSNLAAVHRNRLFAQHLPSFGWEPFILAVKEKYYEENLDWNLVKLLPEVLRIEKVNAFPVFKPRFIGDIGLRAFFQLFFKAKQLITKEKINFLYIPIPSFYSALLGRLLHTTTGVKYGIDYIDPWVHKFPGSEKKFSRHWWSTQFAELLEPIAVKKASIITGVAEGYYKGVIERNPHLVKTCLFGAMPYGGEAMDHEKVKILGLKAYLFKRIEGKIKLIYAGAMLPKAYKPLEAIFQAIKQKPETFKNVEFHFVGTGKTPNDTDGYTVKPIAEKYGLWDSFIFEYPARIPYLDVLIHLEEASGVFILGSTEPHYTPSKVYQAVLSKKPIFAVLHAQSTACTVIQKSKTGLVLGFNGEDGITLIEEKVASCFDQFRSFLTNYTTPSLNTNDFQAYSAKSVTNQLALLLNQIP